MASRKVIGRCCCSCPAASCRPATAEPVPACAAEAAAAAEATARNRVLDVCSRPKKIPLMTEAVEKAVERCSTCSCWEAARIPPEQRSFYCCLCMQQRERYDCIFWASPWQSSYRTFAAFTDPVDAAAAAAEHQVLHSSSNSGDSSTAAPTVAKRKVAFFGKLRRLLRAAFPLFLVMCTIYFVSVATTACVSPY